MLHRNSTRHRQLRELTATGGHAPLAQNCLVVIAFSGAESNQSFLRPGMALIIFPLFLPSCSCIISLALFSLLLLLALLLFSLLLFTFLFVLIRQAGGLQNPTAEECQVFAKTMRILWARLPSVPQDRTLEHMSPLLTSSSNESSS